MMIVVTLSYTAFCIQKFRFESALDSKLDLFNQVSLLTLLYCLMMLTDFVPEATTRYQIGAFYTAIVLLNLLLHLTKLVIFTCKITARKIRQRKRMKKVHALNT